MPSDSSSWAHSEVYQEHRCDQEYCVQYLVLSLLQWFLALFRLSLVLFCLHYFTQPQTSFQRPTLMNFICSSCDWLCLYFDFLFLTDYYCFWFVYLPFNCDYDCWFGHGLEAWGFEICAQNECTLVFRRCQFFCLYFVNLDYRRFAFNLNYCWRSFWLVFSWALWLLPSWWCYFLFWHNIKNL